jgi:hypothetical protein
LPDSDCFIFSSPGVLANRITGGFFPAYQFICKLARREFCVVKWRTLGQCPLYPDEQAFRRADVTLAPLVEHRETSCGQRAPGRLVLRYGTHSSPSREDITE